MTKLLRNENDVDTKIVPLILEKMGFSSEYWTSQFPISVGRKVVFADFFVSSNFDDVNNGANLIIESKSDSEVLENYKKQAISYGRLTKSKISILLNSTKALIIDNDTEKVTYQIDIHDLPKIINRKNYFIKKNIIHYSLDKIESAKVTIKKIEEINDFSSIFEKCQDFIRNIDGMTGSDAFDELSKILFIKIYLEENNKSYIFTEENIEKNGISVIKKNNFDEVKLKYRDIFSETDIINLKDETILEIVKVLSHYDLRQTEIDVKGRAYEILLGKTFIGSLGQHFTPRQVVNFMVDFLNPSSRLSKDVNVRIIDPACGSGGFLIKCLEQFLVIANKLNLEESDLKIIREKTIYGTDLNERSVRVAKMNMSLHGDGKGGLFQVNGLTGNDEINSGKFDYVITNPPFGVKVKDEKILDRFKYLFDKRNKSKEGVNAEILFVGRCIELLRDGGKLGILIPDGLINNKTTINVRDYIETNLDIDAVISLPDRTFKSANANAVTSILFGTKKAVNKNEYVFMSLAEEIGFERKTKNAKQISENDLPAIYQIYQNYCSRIDEYNRMNENIIVLSSNPVAFLIKKNFIKGKRLDAPYYYSTYVYPSTYNKKVVPLSKFAKQIKRNLVSIDNEIPYLEFSSIVPQLGIIANHKLINNESRPNRAKYLVRNKDILCAKMRDSETNIAIVPEEYDESLATNGFIVLKPIHPMTIECLYYLLASSKNINQVRWKASGTIMPTVDDDEYLKNWVPDLEEEEINEITKRVKPKIDKMLTSIKELVEEFDK